MAGGATDGKSLSARIDLAWGFGSFFLQFGTGFLVLPALLHFLTPEQLGLWYAYQVVGGLALLLEFGYQGTFARNITYAANGAESLQLEGIAHFAHDAKIGVNYQLLSSILYVMRRKYRQISLAILVVLGVPGTAYVLYVGRHESMILVCTTWLLFTGFSATAFYLGRFTVVLTGLNEVRRTQQFQVFARIVSVAFIIFLLWAGAGLTGAVIGYGIGVITAPLCANFAARMLEPYRRSFQLRHDSNAENLEDILWHNARRMGQVSVGSFLQQRATSLIASAFMPLGEFASFSLTLQIIQMLSQVARVKLHISFPALVGHAGRGRLAEFRSLFLACLAMSWVVYLAGVAGLLIFGREVVSMLGSSISLLDANLIVMLGLLYLLDMTHGNCAMALTCFNTVPFVAAMWITGAAIAVSSLLIAVYTGWGVAGFVAAQLVCQMTYNVWKWPLELNARCHGFLPPGSRAQ